MILKKCLSNFVWEPAHEKISALEILRSVPLQSNILNIWNTIARYRAYRPRNKNILYSSVFYVFPVCFKLFRWKCFKMFEIFPKTIEILDLDFQISDLKSSQILQIFRFWNVFSAYILNISIFFIWTRGSIILFYIFFNFWIYSFFCLLIYFTFTSDFVTD